MKSKWFSAGFGAVLGGRKTGFLTGGISCLDLLTVHITQPSPWSAFIAGSWHCSRMKLDVVLIIWRRLSLKVRYFRNF